MKIRKVYEKPAVIHKKEHTRVRTAKRGKPRQSVFHLRDKEKRDTSIRTDGVEGEDLRKAEDIIQAALCMAMIRQRMISISL